MFRILFKFLPNIISFKNEVGTQYRWVDVFLNIFQPNVYRILNQLHNWQFILENNDGIWVTSWEVAEAARAQNVGEPVSEAY